MTVKMSLDSGDSWMVNALLYAGKAAYSVMVPIDSAQVGVVYERGVETYAENITLAIITT